MEWAVVKSYSFDPSTEVFLFPTEDEACEFVKRKYKEAFDAEKKASDECFNGFSPDDCHCEEDGQWGQLVWKHGWEDASDTYVLQVVGISKAD